MQTSGLPVESACPRRTRRARKTWPTQLAWAILPIENSFPTLAASATTFAPIRVLRGQFIGLLFAVMVFAAYSTSAAEIYSNATGGGAWSDKATWKGGAVPGPDDDVVIARDDVVVFDRNDDAAVTCHQLSLDPRSVLAFKTGAGTIVLCAGAQVESYGTIKLDGTKAAGDQLELRLVAEDPEERVLKIAKGGGLVLSGRNGLAKGRHNVLLRSLPPVKEPPAGQPPVDQTGNIDAQAGSTLDVARADVVNVYMQASYIDNTGAKPGERINIVRNHFTGTSRLLLTGCDTPLVADNLFERDAQPPLQQPAVYFNGCPLADVHGNTIRGTYSGGMTGYGQTDSTVVNNLIEKCPQGLYWYGSNAMFRQLTIRDCNHGMTLTSMSGALEDVTIEGCMSGYHHGGATTQFTNLVIRNMQPNSPYKIYYSSGPLTLLNCNLKPEDIVWAVPFVPQPAKDNQPRPPTVQSLSFLVAKVEGELPPGAGVEIRTAGAARPAGAADPNVRNSPAALSSKRLTPLPKTLQPLIVRTWMFDADAKLVQPPEYVLNVVGRAPVAAGAERLVLKSIPLKTQTDWFRPEPNDSQPTIEVKVP